MWKILTISENKEFLALASGNLGEQGEQVIGNALGVLAHDTTGVGTSGVEVAQQSSVPFGSLGLVAGLGSVVALGVDDVRNGELNGVLGVAVGVCRAERAHLGDRDHVGEAGGISVDGSGAGEDDVGDVVADHGAEEADCAVDVDMVVVEGLLAGFADSLVQCMSNAQVLGWMYKRTFKAAK